LLYLQFNDFEEAQRSISERLENNTNHNLCKGQRIKPWTMLFASFASFTGGPQGRIIILKNRVSAFHFTL